MTLHQERKRMFSLQERERERERERKRKRVLFRFIKWLGGSVSLCLSVSVCLSVCLSVSVCFCPAFCNLGPCQYLSREGPALNKSKQQLTSFLVGCEGAEFCYSGLLTPSLVRFVELLNSRPELFWNI